jgi:hypothetical protein
MNRRTLFFSIRLLLAVSLGLSLAGSALAQNSNKPPKNDPGPTLPKVRYSISLLPHDMFAHHANHAGMIVGTCEGPGHYGVSACFYDSATNTFYDFNAESSLMDQLQVLAPGTSFYYSKAINESGAIVGVVIDADGIFRQGFVIDINDAPDDVTQWELELLPNFGSPDSNALHINDVGDVLANYQVFDESGAYQGIHYYVVNPWLDPDNVNVRELPFGSGTPTSPGRAITRLNNQGLVAVAKPDRILVYDANVNPPQFVREVAIAECRLLWINDTGVIGGVTLYERLGGRKSYDVAFQEDGMRANIYLSSPGNMANAPNVHEFMNSQRDMTFSERITVNGTTRYVDYLYHRGFTSNDHVSGLWRIDDLIDANDPNRSQWDGPSVSFLSERSDSDDASGYPVMVASLGQPAILMPHIVP